MTGWTRGRPSRFAPALAVESAPAPVKEVRPRARVRVPAEEPAAPVRTTAEPGAPSGDGIDLKRRLDAYVGKIDDDEKRRSVETRLKAAWLTHDMAAMERLAAELDVR